MPLGTGVEVTVNTVYRMIQQELEKHGYNVPEPIYDKPRKGEIYRNYCDITKAAEILGYHPSISLKKGIQETVEWFINRKNIAHLI